MLISQLTVGQPGWWGWGQEEHCCPKSSPGPSGPSWQDEGKVRGKLEAGHISPGHSQPQASKECTESQAMGEGAMPCAATGTIWPSHPPASLSCSTAHTQTSPETQQQGRGPTSQPASREHTSHSTEQSGSHSIPAASRGPLGKALKGATWESR